MPDRMFWNTWSNLEEDQSHFNYHHTGPDISGPVFNMEILAPIGNKEAFQAVLECQPDSAYFGLKNYNARHKAHNFTIDQAGYIIDTCRDRNIRTYITLNTLIKNNEINDAAKLLSAISTMRPDGIIMQDTGLIWTTAKYFPSLNIFASTQTSNLDHLKTNFFQKMGIKRLILERQLTISDIKAIKKLTNADLEVFILGAVCYSISGLCLFSSYNGGNSANRGLCTQPCRRLYDHKGHNKFLFSLKDMDWRYYVPELKKIGIKGIKIEGRMKSGNYVREAISYIKNAGPSHKPVTRSLCSLLMDNASSIYHPPISGKFIGNVIKCEKGKLIISSDLLLKEQDTIRIIDENRDINSRNIKVISVNSLKSTQILTINSSDNYNKGLKVYLVSRDDKLQDPFKNKKLRHVKLSPSPKIKSIKTKKKYLQNEEVFIVDHPKMLDHLPGKKVFIEYAVLPYLKKHVPHGIVLPPIIKEECLKQVKTHAQKLGIKNIMVSDEGQLNIFKGFTLYQDPHMKNLNCYSNAYYSHSNISYTSYFIEGDMSSLLSFPRSTFISLFSRPMLFISKVPPLNFHNNYTFKDLKNNWSYLTIKKNDIYYTVPECPVNLLSLKTELIKYGFSNFIYDLRFFRPQRIIFENFPQNLFNIKKGLK